MIKVISNKTTLADFENEWNNLFEIDATVTPFQSYEYIISSIDFEKDTKSTLHIIFIKDDPTNQWVAIFPFKLNNNGILHYINCAHTDFCAPIIHPDFKHFNLYKELCNYISENTQIKGLDLTNQTSGNQLLSVLKPHFKYTIVHDINYYSSVPVYALPNDKDAIDAFRFVQSKQRRNLRKILSQIDNDCEFCILSTKSGDRFPEKQINHLVNKMISDGIRAREYFNESMLSFWKHLYEYGILSIALISHNGTIESCNFMFYDQKHNQYIKWIMLYVENSWNMKINLKLTQYIYNNGNAEINFARGIYDYKLVNFHPDVKPLFRVIIAKTKWGHFKNIISTAFHFSKPIIKSWLRR